MAKIVESMTTMMATAAIVMLLLGQSSAQSGCTTVMMTLMPCLSYITGNITSPDASCCSGLASVVKSQPRCLCTVLNGGTAPMGITVNQTQALALPGACNVQTPPVSQCNEVGGEGPAAAPVSETKPTTSATTTNDVPAASGKPSTTSSSAVPSGGSKATPSGQTSEGFVVSLSLKSTLLLSLLVMAKSYL